MSRKFIRANWTKKVRLGRKHKKNQKWRRARGRHSKIREKRKGRTKKVEIGYKNNKKERGKIRGKEVIMIRNLKDVGRIKKGNLVILAKLGKKKIIEIEDKIKEKGGEIINIRK
jgi:large subunit ribosomal protein L32e